MSELASILNHMEKRSSMWFGHRATIEDISAFILGFQNGQRVPPDPLSFEYFTRWVAAHYRVVDGARNAFIMILEHVGGDKDRAADEFFRLFPLYVKDLSELGGDGVHAHYSKVMIESRKPHNTTSHA